jgi:hypothetical protein
MGAYSADIMMSHADLNPSVAEICASVKRLGYGVSQSIRLYGEEFEVISDPFPEAGGIAVNVKAKSSNGIRVVQLPATVLQRVKRPNAA